jgi:uncharacterized protein with FMN-binding domain
MRRTKWRGTILFSVILVVMGATVGLRLYGIGTTATASPETSVSSTASSQAATPAPTTTSGAATTPTATPSTPTTASATKVITGSVEDTRYGPMQVQVTFDGSKITAVKVLQAPNDDRRSASINEQATPILEQEVLSSQSANVDTVSGATYTSDGYKQSVQSAIDQL